MTNFHTHTYLCRHASGTPLDLAREAEKRGVTVLGISDHVPFPDGRLASVRMKMEELDTYLEMIREAQAAFPGVRIYAGLECEYFPEFHDYYRFLLHEKHLDYLIGSVHSFTQHGETHGFWDGCVMDEEGLSDYTQSYVGMLKSGFFRFGAHPDTFGAVLSRWDERCDAAAEKIARAAVAADTPLEINTSGWLKKANRPDLPMPYPLVPFWEVAARCGVKAVVNSDAHAPEHLDSYLDEGYAFARARGVACTAIFP